jgi:NAD(P)H dehydrogenase (quinone)
MNKVKTKRCAIVVCHPRERSFVSSVAARVENAAHLSGYQTIVRDLYAMAFDPVLHARDIALHEGGSRPAADVEQEISLLDSPEVIILIYPIWFGSPPGMLKGYVERVLGAGFAGPGTVPVAAGRRPKLLLTIATSGATSAWIEKKGIAASAGRVFGAYLAGALDIPRSEHIAVDNVIPTMSQARGEAALDRVENAVREALAGHAPAKPTINAAWDTLPHPAA